VAPAIVVFTRDNFNPRQSPCRVGVDCFLGSGATLRERVERFKGGILNPAAGAAFNECKAKLHRLEAEQEPFENAPPY
jgi:hypothetical protein